VAFDTKCSIYPLLKSIQLLYIAVSIISFKKETALNPHRTI